MDSIKGEDLQPPKIDLELCTSDNNMAPIDKVYAMDEDSFEKFTIEWLYGCRKSQYKKIVRIGGAGDKGRDVIGYYQDGSCDYYQCKHYDSQLSPSVFDVEFGKLCYYTWKKEIKTPNKYFIVASHNIGPKLADLLNAPDKLKKELINTWDAHCKKEITNKEEITLSKELRKHITKFNFSIVEYIPIEEIINEHIKTIYGKIRFGGERISIPNLLEPPHEINTNELPYVNALLEAYSDEAKETYLTVKDIEKNDKYITHFNRQRKDYYAIETVRRFVRDTFINSNDFENLKNEIYEGIIDIHEEDYDSGLKRLRADLEQAVRVNITSSLLESKLHIIKNEQRKGVCHLLVEDKKIRWVIK